MRGGRERGVFLRFVGATGETGRSIRLRELLIMQTRLPDDAWKSYPGAGLTDNGGGKAMYLSFTSFSRRSTETGGDGTLPNKNGGFRFNAAEGSGSIGATGTGDLDNGYVRGVKDEQ